MSKGYPEVTTQAESEFQPFSEYLKKNHKGTLAGMILLAAGAAAYNFAYPSPDTLKDEEVEAFRARNDMTVDSVKRFYEGRGTSLTDAEAANLLAVAKSHLANRRAIMEQGDYVEVMPGGHYPASKMESLAKESEVAENTVSGSRKRLAPILDDEGEPMKNAAGEIVLAAEPVAEILTKVNRRLKSEKDEELSISYCYRSDEMQAIAWAGIHGHGPVREAGDSVHQTGLACDINNAFAAQDFLAEEGMIGGCYGSMYGTDYGHFSFGEMQKRGSALVEICKRTPPKAREVQEKVVRGTKKTRQKIGQALDKAKSTWNNFKNQF